jgi:hypothetical protein
LSPSSRGCSSSAPGRADFASAKLDAGIEASGPHDFTVHSNIVRLRARTPLTGWTPPCDHDCAPTLPRPPHPCPTSVTIAKRPSVWAGMAGILEMIWVAGEAEYFCKLGWTTQITLIRFTNLGCARTPAAAEFQASCVSQAVRVMSQSRRSTRAGWRFAESLRSSWAGWQARTIRRKRSVVSVPEGKTEWRAEHDVVTKPFAQCVKKLMRALSRKSRAGGGLIPEPTRTSRHARTCQSREAMRRLFALDDGEGSISTIHAAQCERAIAGLKQRLLWQ